MIPFPGESVGVDVALIREGLGVYDETLWDSIRNRGGIGGAPPTRTLESDEWRAWVYPGSQTYLEDDATDVVVSWVVEVTDGIGTITASMGFDPDFGEPEAAHPTSLGSHPVAGPATLVLPTTLTAADVMSGTDSMMLVLTSSAPLDVAQVKLRVWPPEGVAGGWVDRGGFETPPNEAAIRYGAESIVAQATAVDPEDSWDAAYFDFVGQITSASATAPRAVTTTPTAGVAAEQGAAVVDVFTGDIQSTTRLELAVVVIHGADWRDFPPISGDLTEGVDWIIPPTEVNDDDAAIAPQGDDGGTGWGNAFVTVTTSPGIGEDMPGEGGAGSVGGLFPTDDGFVTMALTHSPATGLVPLDTNGQDIAVTISHTVAIVTADDAVGKEWPGPPWDDPGVLGAERSDVVNFALGFGGEPVLTWAIMPSYQAWSPTAVPVVAVDPLRLMQRGDGLGMGSARLFGPGTRQGSSRVFGSL